MKTCYGLVVVGCVFLVVGQAKAQKKDPSKVCKDKKAADVDEQLLKNGFEKGLYVAMMKKLLDIVASPDILGGDAPADKRKWNTKVCFKAKMNSPLGPVEGDGACKYNKTSHMTCTGFAGGAIGIGGAKTYGDAWITKTDNTTYALLIGCLHNKKAFWVVFSLTEKVAPEKEKDVLTYLEGLGFDKEDAAPPEDPMRGTKMTATPCPKEEVGGDPLKDLFGG